MPHPTPTLTLIPTRWYHGKMSRDDATSLLAKEAAGSFLVRESANTAGGGDLSISFRVPSGVKHFKVRMTE